MIIEVLRALISFASQQIRFSMFLIVLERIIATIKLEGYKLESSLTLFWGLTLFTYLVSICITAVVYYGGFLYLPSEVVIL